MMTLRAIFKPAVAASHAIVLAGGVGVAVLAGAVPGQAQDLDLDDLMAQLADPATENWQQLERQIRTEWSRSGSAAMDILLQRGEKALEDERFDVALEHFTALTDHAPDFAEGWNARATALFRKGLFGPAIEDLGKALALNPDHFGALTGLAVILQEVQMYPEALEVWRRVEMLHPHRPELGEAMQALDLELGGRRL